MHARLPHEILRVIQNVNKRRRISISLFELGYFFLRIKLLESSPTADKVSWDNRSEGCASVSNR